MRLNEAAPDEEQEFDGDTDTSDGTQLPEEERTADASAELETQVSTELVADAAEAQLSEPASGAEVEADDGSAGLEESSDLEGAEAETGAEDGEQPEVVEEVEKPEGTHWYVIHSYSGYENKVRQNLLQRIESMEMEDLIFNVVVPTEEEVEIKDGHRRIYKKRVFPGYVLVEMFLDENSWYVVRNTPGVTGFVGSGSHPTPLREEEVDKIIARMEVETPKIKVGFREGQTVRIVDGPFADFMGTVDEIYLDRGKVRVLVSMFGRETPIELDFLQVEKL